MQIFGRFCDVTQFCDVVRDNDSAVLMLYNKPVHSRDVDSTQQDVDSIFLCRSYNSVLNIGS